MNIEQILGHTGLPLKFRDALLDILSWMFTMTVACMTGYFISPLSHHFRSLSAR
jgi:hypothetical protein